MRRVSALACVPLVLATALAGSPARADDKTDATQQAVDAIAQDLMTITRSFGDVPVSTARDRAALRFRSLDLDANGFSQADLDLAKQTANATVRSRAMTEWLARDLDWDGQVTQEELRASLMQQARRPLRAAAGQLAPTEQQVETALQQLIDKMNLPDPDGDGVTTLAEMQAAAADGGPSRSRHVIRGA